VTLVATDQIPQADSVASGGQGDRTRARILAAAVELIEEHGEAGMRVVDVGERAGVAVASIYTYFVNRDDLVISARIEQYVGAVGEDMDRVQSVVETAATPDEMVTSLQAITKVASAPERAERRWLRAEVLGAARRRPRLAARLAEQQRESNERFRRIVKTGQERGLIDPALDATALSIFVQAFTFGLLLAEIDPASELDQDDWLAVVNRFASAIVSKSSD
jgi:AcrR family transcriptional regulator